jgi:hypothetical protein
MQTFLFLFIGHPAEVDADDEETRDYNARWTDWIGELAGSGRLVGGQPLEWRGSVVSRAGTSELALDDPDLGAWMAVKADSLDHAVRTAQGAPSVQDGGTVIVRPAIDVPN